MAFAHTIKTAELVGILLGDGSFYVARYNHELDIALNSRDIQYKDCVKALLLSVTNTYVFEKPSHVANCIHLRISRKDPVSSLMELSAMKQGNKIKNQVTIPNWVWNDTTFLASCLKGLIDTDGSVYRLKPQWPNLFQISFKNNSHNLVDDVRNAFLKLGFHPSRVFGNRVVLTRQKEVATFFKKIGTNNDRNLKLYDEFMQVYKDKKPLILGSPIV